MTGLALVEYKCKELGLDLASCTSILKEILKYGGKDLRSAPLVRRVLESMKGKTQEQILKALEITKYKYEHMDEGNLHPNYFIAVLKKNSPGSTNVTTLNDDINLNWGKSI